MALTACSQHHGKQVFNAVSVGELASLTPAAGTSGEARRDQYQVNVGDELDIKVDGHDDLNGTVKVRPDGNVTLPLIGELKALGKATADLESEIERRYRSLSVRDDSVYGDGKKEYLIAVNDELAVKFPFHGNMDQTVKVRPDGKVSLSLLGSVVAEGKSPQSLNRELNRKYQKFLKNPNVAVVVNQFNSMRYRQAGEVKIAGFDRAKTTITVKASAPLEVFVGGNVLRPGLLHYRKTLTAMTAIVEAGGEALGAEMSNVVLLRKHEKQPIATTLDLSNEFKPELASHDILLRPHDIVIVPNSKIDEVGDFVEDLVRTLPPIRNSTFGLFYGL